MTDNYSTLCKAVQLELYVDPTSKSGATKLVGENLTQQFESGLFGLKLLVWFALEEEGKQFGWVWVEQQVDGVGLVSKVY